MCKIEWTSNLHLLSQFTFSSAFFPNTCFNTKLPGACRRNGLGGQAVYLELNAFLCFSPRGRLAFPAAPRLGAQTGYLEGGAGHVAVSHSSSLVAQGLTRRGRRTWMGHGEGTKN